MSYRCYEDIKTQASAWEAALAAVESRAEDLEKLFAEEEPGELLFAACGSPYYLGLANATLWRERLGLRVTVVPSSEIMLFPETVLPRAGRPLLLIASRSGETTETLRAAETFAERSPGRTILIGCRSESRMGRRADLAIVIPEGDEDVIPQTRSFSSMYLAAQYLVALLADDAELAGALRRLPGLLPGLLERGEPVVQGAAEADWNQAFFLGGGPLYGVAVEATLKLTEMSLSSAVAYHTLEVRHGPRSIIDESTLVVGLGSLRGATYERQVLAELARETPRVLALTPGEGWDLSEIATEIPLGDQIPEHALGLLYLPLLQLLAYHRALHKRVNPDESRNLTSHIELPEGS
jgi:glucosamine--fructose-6-phosphate aminotransferase (isomerizing)